MSVTAGPSMLLARFRLRTAHTVESVASFLLEEVVLKFGVFREILTDGAPELTGKVIEKLVVMLQARQINPVPYRPQMIGLVERFNRTWKDCVSTFMTHEKQVDWNLWVKFAVYAYNSAPQSTVALTPNELMMGQRLRPPNELPRRTALTEAGALPAYHADLLEAMRRSHECAERARRKDQARQAKYYNRRRKQRRTFETGDRVWLYNPPRGPKATKFVHQWMGPLRIVEPAGYENYLLEREDKTGEKETIVARVSFMVSFHYPAPLLAQAAADIDEELADENHEQDELDEEAPAAVVRAATAARDSTKTRRSTNRRRTAMTGAGGMLDDGGTLVEPRRRRVRNRAGQYVLEYELRGLDGGQTGAADVERRWVTVGQYEQLVNDGRVLESSVGLEARYALLQWLQM
ncbi:hypothetical protein PC110_g20011 [Phytophthora cactorum]|uniref:Integrase catalytic domain-containing protein n=2 Tax=Phytophthora cactorum TaxID=29920 RepID=A0A329RFW6_9STRA|nr:hypothetical protein PC113_g11367 [Phytophthora cactorum]RAW23555.1 hypothetical protein PC110_g20011 [Phytophthora cactorum]